MNDKWNNASSYESYIGRWSRLVAIQFLDWLESKENLDWLDIGCGTGALSNQILRSQKPHSVTGMDPSADYVEFCNKNFQDERAKFLVGDAIATSLQQKFFDVIVSGLVLNFVSDIPKAVTEFKRVARTNATVAAYVWDYTGKMELLRYFWDAAISLFARARELDEGVRFPMCNPSSMHKLFSEAGYQSTEVTLIDVPTVFKDFNDLWTPFENGQGPAPGFYQQLATYERKLLKEKIFSSLPVHPDGRIHLVARAIAVKGKVK